MKPFGEPIPFETAQETIEQHTLPVERTQSLRIDDAFGRILAEDILAHHSTPPFDRAAMDGYAVKSEDTNGASKQNPKELKLVDRLYAGSTPTTKLYTGECIEIATGAKMPAGADAVVMVEDTRRNVKKVSILKTIQSLDNVGMKGEDTKEGDVVLTRGSFLCAGKVGVLASQGLRRVTVYDKPVVAIIPTGEEIVEIGRRLKKVQIYDINSHTLSVVVQENGCQAIIFPITGDNIKDIEVNLARALDEADMVVTSGGSSVGEKDLITGVLGEWGEVLFHGVKIKPGKPTTFALVRGKPVLGMPGYPTSCLINAYLMLSPALRKMARLPLRRESFVQAKLGVRVAGGGVRRRFQPVRLECGTAYPILKKSGAITGTAQADGYIIISEDDSYLEKDSPVKVITF